jgi:hypothetical protein
VTQFIRTPMGERLRHADSDSLARLDEGL